MQQSPTIDERLHLRDLTVAEFRVLLASAPANTNARPPPKPFYTIRETAQLLDNTERHVRRLLAKGLLEKRKVATGRGSSKVLVPWESIQRLLSSGED